MSNRGANAPLPDLPSVDRHFRDVNGVTYHVVSAGDQSNPLVVFLHGFPEFWYEWYAYIKPFVKEGYRVLVPDQRGYNRSEKPEGIQSYRLPTLAKDIVSLISTENRDRTTLIGHDWGGTVAWTVALHNPEMIENLGIINMPHPIVFKEALESNSKQQQKSHYIFNFKQTYVPEKTAKRNDFASWVSVMKGSSKPGAFSRTDFKRYRSAWSEPGAPAAMINWYRALIQVDDHPPRETVEAPTLVVWGENDQALIPELAKKSMVYCKQGILERFPDATHWIPHEYPDRVTELLLDHIT